MSPSIVPSATTATATSTATATATTSASRRSVVDVKDQRIDELKSENARLQELVVTQEKALTTKEVELATKEIECQRLRYDIKLLKLLKGIRVSSPVTTVEDIFVSSSAVADVMVEDGIYNGILSKILDYVATTTPSRRRNDNNNDDDDNDGNETIMPAGKTTTTTTTTTTLDKLINLTLVSKRFHRIISTYEENGIKKWKLIPLFVLSPKENNGGNTINFHHTLNQYQQDDDTKRKLQRYLLFRVNHIDKFEHVPDDKFKALRTKSLINMKGIRSLNLSLPSSSTMVPMSNSLPKTLARILPNLHELNLSHTNFHGHDVLSYFSVFCSYLEKVTWTNINIETTVRLDGHDMEYARNLKEINMDDSNFKICFGQQEEKMSDLNNHPSIYIFYACWSTVLERVSIRNAKYQIYTNTSGSCLSQNMLIKFIRNAPATLKWFRSDLSQDNMDMLTKERPGIQLFN